MSALALLIVVVIAVVLFAKFEDLSFKLARLRKDFEQLQAQLQRLQNLRASGPEAEASAPVALPVRPAPPRESPMPPRPIVQPMPLPQPGPVAVAMSSLRLATTKPVDWENFVGVKLFAWVGGFALFLAVVFFVKYSIEHGLISPLMRVSFGFLTGIGAILGGLWMRRQKDYEVTVQTLCAAGISILYADIFACRSFYNFLSPVAAFPFMILVTVAAFFLAVRLNARYVAILGLIGGFLTPPLLSTGVDHPIALFSYILLLDAGLAAVAVRQNWGFLMPMAMLGTFAMEAGWTARFFRAEKATLAAGIYFLFPFFYLAVAEAAERRKKTDALLQDTPSWMALLSLVFVAVLLRYPSVGQRPGLVLTLLLALSAMPAYLSARRESARLVYALAGSAAFLLLAWWTNAFMKGAMLYWGLAYYLAFAVLHALLPIVYLRAASHPSPLPVGEGGRRPGERMGKGIFIGQAAPFLMLVLLLFSMTVCDSLSFAMWPVVMLLGMFAIAVAWFAASLFTALATLALVMGCAGVWLFRLPDVAGLPGILTMLGFLSCAFFAWGLFVTGRKSLLAGNAAISRVGEMDPRAKELLPMSSVTLPFLLLAMVVLKLRMADPSPVYGLMLLLNVLLLALARYRGIEAAPAAALASSVLVQFCWLFTNGAQKNPATLLAWAIGFYALFAGFPFAAKRRLKTMTPWTAAALAGIAHLPMVWLAVRELLGSPYMAVVPGFFAITSLISLTGLLDEPKGERKNSLLAWFGGVTLFFVTAIIPVHFDKEWITLGWALEGAALLWLFRRVPHDGLKTWGLGLLAIAFVRLAINPAVLAYHPRTATPILNWYLFVYGAAIAAYFLAAAWLEGPHPPLSAPPRPCLPAGRSHPLPGRERELQTSPLPSWERVPGGRVRALLHAAGAVLLFLLLNIEIADFYSTGATITFNFSGNLAQDMTYSLAWALFAIVLLMIGIRQSRRPVRYASLALLTLTITKVFLHDLWRLGGLFRVGSIIGLAIILMLVSFLYQRFLATEPREAHHV
jgi:hypothetical protein